VSQPIPGPTGDFPQGKLNESDEGGLNILVTTQKGNVIVAFGKPVAWIGLPPKDAIELANMIIRKAKGLDG
jgi:hypothetical protein